MSHTEAQARIKINKLLEAVGWRFFDSATMQYDNPVDQVRERLVHKNYFSQKDIEACRSFDIDTLSNEVSFPAMRALFGGFLKLYPQDKGAA